MPENAKAKPSQAPRLKNPEKSIDSCFDCVRQKMITVHPLIDDPSLGNMETPTWTLEDSPKSASMRSLWTVQSNAQKNVSRTALTTLQNTFNGRRRCFDDHHGPVATARFSHLVMICIPFTVDGAQQGPTHLLSSLSGDDSPAS